MNTDTPITSALSDLAGKYLTFRLENELYGIPILQVQEIIGLLPITKVPRTPNHMRGVLNLRGKVISVVDLRAKFSLSQGEDTERTCIVVVQTLANNRLLTVGVVVDEVCEVLYLNASQIEPTPAFSDTTDVDFVMAMGKAAKHVVMLLDIDQALDTAEWALTAA